MPHWWKEPFTNCFPVKWIPFDGILPTVDLLFKVESILSDPDTVLKNYVDGISYIFSCHFKSFPSVFTRSRFYLKEPPLYSYIISISSFVQILSWAWSSHLQTLFVISVLLLFQPHLQLLPSVVLNPSEWYINVGTNFIKCLLMLLFWLLPVNYKCSSWQVLPGGFQWDLSKTNRGITIFSSYNLTNGSSLTIRFESWSYSLIYRL